MNRPDAAGPGDDRGVGKPQKQAMLDDAWNGMKAI